MYLIIAAVVFLGSVWLLALIFTILYPLRARHSLRYYWQVESGFILFQFYLISLTFVAIFTRELATEPFLQIVIWPIWGPIYGMTSTSKYWDFVATPLMLASIAMAMVARWQWKKGQSWKRSLWPTKGLLAFFAIFLLAAEIRFQWQFRSAALRMNPDCVVPGTFINSLSITPANLQIFLHAQMLKNGTKFGWSYREQDLYLVPERAANNAGAKLGFPNWTGYPVCPWRPRKQS